MHEPPDVIEIGRSYTLAAGEDFYGIWEKGKAGEPIRRFPLTEDGYEEAERTHAAMEAQARLERRGPSLTYALRVTLFVSLALWIVAGLVSRIWYLFVFESTVILPDYGLPGESAFTQALGIVEGTAYRTWIGALALLVTLRWLSPGTRRG